MNQKNIGTYNEKTIHALLKKRYESNEKYHEIRYKNYIADIKKDNRIYEIQSANFYRMRDKIEAFTAEDDLMIVFPIPREKNIVWIDPDTGESSKPRRSPKKGSEYDIFHEIYMIRDLISNPRLGFIAVLMDVTSALIPNSLENEFTAKDFSVACRISLSLAQKTLYIMRLTGSVMLKRKNGRQYI